MPGAAEIGEGQHCLLSKGANCKDKNERTKSKENNSAPCGIKISFLMGSCKASELLAVINFKLFPLQEKVNPAHAQSSTGSQKEKLWLPAYELPGNSHVSFTWFIYFNELPSPAELLQIDFTPPQQQRIYIGWITSTFSWCSLLMYSQKSFTLPSCKRGATVPSNLLSNLIELEVAHPHLATKSWYYRFVCFPSSCLLCHLLFGTLPGKHEQLVKEDSLPRRQNSFWRTTPKKSIGLFKVVSPFSRWNW